jgi:hypothetical protein
VSAAPEVREVHPFGGITSEEALLVYDFGRGHDLMVGAEAKQIEEIGRRVTAELRLLERAEDYPGIVKYVQEVWDSGDLALSLENVLDDLDRGMSDVCDGLAEWRRDRKKAKKQAKRDRVLLAEAGDERCAELEAEIATGDLPRGDVSRMKRELRALTGAVYRAWERIQK